MRCWLQASLMKTASTVRRGEVSAGWQRMKLLSRRSEYRSLLKSRPRGPSHSSRRLVIHFWSLLPGTLWTRPLTVTSNVVSRLGMEWFTAGCSLEIAMVSEGGWHPGVEVSDLLKHGEAGQRKRLIGKLVERITLAPDRREVEITYRVPESVMNGLVAGDCNAPNVLCLPFRLPLVAAS